MHTSPGRVLCSGFFAVVAKRTLDKCSLMRNRTMFWVRWGDGGGRRRVPLHHIFIVVVHSCGERGFQVNLV